MCSYQDLIFYCREHLLWGFLVVGEIFLMGMVCAAIVILAKFE